MPFSEFKFSSQINSAISENGYKNPTPIQTKVIPLVLKREDIMAKAQTGSGKSASFVLPILELLNKKPNSKKPKIKVLVLTPTRELTLQIAEVFKSFSLHLKNRVKIVSVIGGESIGNQLLEVQKGCDIVVATSGRLVDIINKKQIDFSSLEFFVLDEADKMVDAGFELELDLILDVIPSNRQNLLFSATYPQKIVSLASKITKKAIEVSVESEQATVEGIVQRVIEVNNENRGPLLRELITTNNWKQVLVFMANKRAADNIAAKFRKYGFKADSFHGDLLQEERNATLKDFKSKKIEILFATDIASRGLHIDDISCVVNFDLPRSPADYIHRIGRTARAGKSGIAISFISDINRDHFKLIQKRSNINLQPEQIEGFELKKEEVVKTKGKAPVKGKRKSKKDKLRELQEKDI